MRLEINLLARRPIKILHIFEILDVVLFVVFCCLAPFVGYMFLHLPFSWTLFVCSTPMLIFIFKFRVRRRAGYFQHWLDYKVRPHYWVGGLGQRFRWDDFPQRVMGYTNAKRSGLKEKSDDLGL